MNDMFGGGGGPIDNSKDNVGPAPDNASTRFSNEAFERTTPTTKQDDSSSAKAGDNAVSKPAESGVEATTENLNSNEAAISGTLEGMGQTVDKFANGMSTQQGADLVRQTAASFANQSLELATARNDKYGIQAAQMMQKQFGTV